MRIPLVIQCIVKWETLHLPDGDDGTRVLTLNTSAVDLDFDWIGLGNEGAKAIAMALQTNSSTRSLSMKGNLFGDDGAVAIASVLNANTTLVDLALYDNSIADVGTIALADALKRNTSLQRLSLGNMLGDEGVTAMANALKVNTTVVHLELHGNSKFGDRRAKAMAEALKVNKTLTCLTVYGCICDEGAIAIADSLAGNATLRSLYMWNTAITNRGGRAIFKAVKSTKGTTRCNYTLSALQLTSSKISSQLRDGIEHAVETKRNRKRLQWEATGIFIYVRSRAPCLNPHREEAPESLSS
jgi:Leucine Rich repeat